MQHRITVSADISVINKQKNLIILYLNESYGISVYS